MQQPQADERSLAGPHCRVSLPKYRSRCAIRGVSLRVSCEKSADAVFRAAFAHRRSTGDATLRTLGAPKFVREPIEEFPSPSISEMETFRVDPSLEIGFPLALGDRWAMGSISTGAQSQQRFFSNCAVDHRPAREERMHFSSKCQRRRIRSRRESTG
jgi:hypothetical protein